MRSQVVQTLGSPGSFDITDKDNPLYYIARYCHECSMNLYELNADGFRFEQLEKSEVEIKLQQYSTWRTSLITWFTTAVAASEAGTAIPSLPSTPSFMYIPGGSGLLEYTLNQFIRVAFEWLKKKLDSDTDATEIAQVLKRAFLGEDGSGDEYALIEQMANTPLEIVVSKADGFEDISYADRPET